MITEFIEQIKTKDLLVWMNEGIIVFYLYCMRLLFCRVSCTYEVFSVLINNLFIYDGLFTNI